MIVRELLTRIGYKVDRKGEQRAKMSFDKLRVAATALGGLLATGVVAQGFRKMVGAASDVEETMNVVTTAFENQTQAVLDWARTSGEASGRSEFAMREYAATVGAVVGPTLGSAEATADLSTNMAQLAVDLGSFFNATDDEALQALRSGLIGQSEPMLRFGVAMNVAALDAFALEEGIGKTTKQMSQAEKIQLRYRFIMARTSKAQGDAEKTSDGFANQLKRLEGNVRDMAVGLGKELLPTSAGFLQSLNGIAKTIQGPIIFGFRSLLNAFRMVGAIIVGLVAGFFELDGIFQALLVTVAFFAAAFLAPWLLAPILIGAAIAGIVVILDDLWTALQGGESVLGGLVAEFNYWLEESGSVLGAFGQILKNAIDFWGEIIFGFGDTTELLVAWVAQSFIGIGESINDALGWVKNQLIAFGDWWFDFFGGLGSWVGDLFSDFTVWMDPIHKFIDRITMTLANLPTGVLDFLSDKLGDLSSTFGLAGPGATQPGRGAAAGGGDVNANQTIEVNVNAPGGDGPAIAGAVAPAVGRAAAEGNRRTAQQLLLGGVTP